MHAYVGAYDRFREYMCVKWGCVGKEEGKVKLRMERAPCGVGMSGKGKGKVVWMVEIIFPSL